MFLHNFLLYTNSCRSQIATKSKLKMGEHSKSCNGCGFKIYSLHSSHSVDFQRNR